MGVKKTNRKRMVEKKLDEKGVEKSMGRGLKMDEKETKKDWNSEKTKRLKENRKDGEEKH